MKKSKLLIALSVVVSLASCKKDLLDINKNPNAATSSTPQLTMPIALEGVGRIIATQYFNYGYWVGFYAGSSGFSKPATTYNYDITNTYQAGTWDALYNNLQDINYVETQAKELGLPMYVAVAKVLKVIDYQQLVDQWGNVAYSQSLQGKGNFAPAYDDAQTIYEDLVKKIDSAVTIFKDPKTAESILFNTDQKRIIMFNDLLDPDDVAGSIPVFIDQWIRFANTVKLRLLVMQSQIPGRDGYIQQNLAGLTPADFLQAGEDAVVDATYLSTKDKYNPIYGFFYKDIGSTADNYNSIKASANAAATYTKLNDTRYGYVFNNPAVGSIFGDPSGTPGASGFKTGSGFFVDPEKPAPVITSAESLFLQAEAVQRGYLTGSAQTLYEDAVTASFTFDGLAADAATYLAQADSAISWNINADKIEVIIGQKWLALNGLNTLSVYNDYRRTGFPRTASGRINAPLSTDPTSKGKVPLRLFYPQNEVLYNGGAVTGQGNIDVFNTPIFWDK